MQIAKFPVVRTQPNPWTDWQKIGVGDYVGDDSPHAKIQNDRPIGGMAVYAWNITLVWFLVFLSFFVTPNFASIPRLNHRIGFYAVCFIWRQFRIITFLEG